jgi:hypothetical protein
VAQHGGKQLVQPQRFGERLELPRELLLLAVELEEDIRLALQNMRLDVFVEKSRY